jgi:hypothetical protein
MSSNGIIAAANQEIREADGTEVLAGSPLLINISDQSLKVVGFWCQHLRYVVGVRADGEIIALNGVAKSVAPRMGWKVLQALSDKKAEHKIMPGIVTLIEIGLTQIPRKDPDAINATGSFHRQAEIA